MKRVAVSATARSVWAHSPSCLASSAAKTASSILVSTKMSNGSRTFGTSATRTISGSRINNTHRPAGIAIAGCGKITRSSTTNSLALCEIATRSFHSSEKQEEVDYLLPHPIWKGEYVNAVEITHRKPETLIDKMAYYSVKLMRFNFDWMSGYSFGKMSESKWLSRVMYLETVAGVPGSLAAMLRHLASLRRVERDHGWIHTLLEEAENERMHLLTALSLKRPSRAFRAAIWVTQGVFANFFFFSYILSPTFCHRFVGYLEEEAVKTYAKMLDDIEDGCLQHWKTTPAPEIARKYWKLPEDATMKDVIYMIRADEAHHRRVNHAFSSMKPYQDNPFRPGE